MIYLVVGLGNPGKEYENTRHNIGRLVLEELRETLSLSEWSFDKYSKSLVTKGVIADKDLVLVQPDNYMNNSGGSLKYFIKSPEMMENLIVVHDDLHLPFGEIKISYGKGDGGHNGVKSIIKHTGTKNFTRLRIGIASKNIFGKIKKQHNISKFVLAKFGARENILIKKILKKSSDAILLLIKDGKIVAMNKINNEG